MLLIVTGIVILVVAYCQYRNGLFTSLAMLIQVILAGVITFNFWEPLADLLDSGLRGGKLEGYEDWLVLTLLFSALLIGMRVATNRLNKDVINYHGILQQAGGALAGALTGYLVAGFLICVIQTLPVEENFLGFEPRAKDEPGYRSYFPPDRVWLSMMRYASAYPLNGDEVNANADSAYERQHTFDRQATFEMRYARYRRHKADKNPLPYLGEFEREVGRKK